MLILGSTHCKKKKFLLIRLAWDYGPVVPDVYHELKEYGYHPIDEIKTDPKLLPSELRGYLNTIWHSYGEYSATMLSDMTHDEKPWKNAYASDSNKIITDKSLAEFYSEENADSLLPQNTVITIKDGQKTLMKLNKETIRRLENPEFEEFDINAL